MELRAHTSEKSALPQSLSKSCPWAVLSSVMHCSWSAVGGSGRFGVLSSVAGGSVLLLQAAGKRLSNNLLQW